MRAVRMEFVEDRRWRWLWATALIIALGFIAGLVWRGYQLNLLALQERERLGSVQLQYQRRQLQLTPATKPVYPVVNPRQANLVKAALWLEQDMNKVFATVENLQEPGSQLRSLSFDSASSTLRLEYELDSMVKASAITESLNKGFESRPWQLETVGATGGAGTKAMGSILPAASSAYMGVWSVHSDKL